MRRWIRRAPGQLAALCCALLALSCATRPSEDTPAQVRPEVRRVLPHTQRTQVDLLFLVDNSNGMGAMSQELRNSFPRLVQVFRDLAARQTFADLHVAVVTSDFGAGKVPGVPGCQVSPGGDRGRMIELGRRAPSGCKGPVGRSYIEYAFADGGARHNLPPGQTLEKTFTCMASVGENGCGFEHQLEAVYAALHDPIPENEGFLRDDAILAVVFVTDEDDCSAPPQSELFDNNRAKVAEFGYLSSYRCARFGVVCGDGEAPPYSDAVGSLASCRPAPNPAGNGPGRLYDVSRYIDFFTRPRSEGGVKRDPGDILLVGIDAPAEPFEVLLSNPGTPGGSRYVPCGALSERSTPACVPVVQHSCVNPSNADFYGDPAVRLNSVIAAARWHRIASICEANYGPIMTDVGDRIVAALAGDCLDFEVPDPPDCAVEDVTNNADGTRTAARLPACDDAPPPCWRIEKMDGCDGISPQGLGVTVDRGDTIGPENTETILTCATCPTGGCGR